MSNLQEIIKDLRKDTSENIKSFIPLSELYTSVMNDIMLKMKISWGKDPALWNFSRNTTSQLVEINEWVTINGLNDSYVGPINSEVKEDYTKDIAAYNTIRHIVKKEYFETGDFARVNSPLPSMVKFLSTKNLELPIDKLTYLAERMVKDFAKSYYTKTLGGESTEKAFPGFGEYLCPEIPKLPSEEVLQNNYKNDDLKNPAKK